MVLAIQGRRSFELGSRPRIGRCTLSRRDATRPSVVALVLCLGCGNELVAPPLRVSGTYDIVQRSIGGTCGFAEDPLPVVLEVTQDGDELTLTVTEPGTGQTFVYVGTIADGGGFVATLSEASPELSFTAESTLEGTFSGASVMATEEFEIRDAEEFGLPDCTDVARWEGNRR